MRAQRHGIEPGLELVYQVFVSVGLARAAAVVLGLGAAFALAQAGLLAWRARQRATAVSAPAWARLAERLAPELGTAATSAVDLERRLATDEAGFSHALAEAHLDSTAVRLTAVDLTRRLREAERPARQRALVASAAALLVALLALAALPQGRRRLAAVLLHPNTAQLIDAPLVADIRLVYRYPAYTGLPNRVVEGGDGSIAAVVGTEVVLSASADTDLRAAELKLEGPDGTASQTLPFQVSKGRNLSGLVPVQRDGRYRLALHTRHGDRLEERVGHAVRAVPDAYPDIAMLAPSKDVELRDTQEVTIDYAAKDDFGVAEVSLVVELEGQKELRRLRVAGGREAEQRREGRYRWSLAEMSLPPGTEGRFYLEAVDNDAISGPKRATSASRRLVLFSAAKHHDEILARQQRVLDALVDWLGADLTAAVGGDVPKALGAHKPIVAQMGALGAELSALVTAMAEDTLAGPEIAAAFANILEHVRRAEHERNVLVGRLAATPRPSLLPSLENERRRAVGQLEKDIIYLDDLLAVQRIDELKRTAKDLLAAQRELGGLLQKYKDTRDPALKAELERRIRALKEQMLGLLARMSKIKQSLPGEYRNLEAASQLAVDDQLRRLEKSLNEGDLDAAARELEQLANMIDDMSQRLDKADEEFGGERYAGIRRQLAQFAEDFKRLEGEQRALTKRSEDMARELREKALKKAGATLERFVAKARAKTAEALQSLAQVGAQDSLYGMQDTLESARQRLLDLDHLLTQKDFAEAQNMVGEALRHEGALKTTLQSRQHQYRLGGATPELDRSAEHAAKAEGQTQEVAEMLAKLLPSGAGQLSKDQQRQAQNLGKKQAQLERDAQRLGQKMDELAGEVPLFGGEPRQSLEGARGEMGQAAGALGGGELPGGAMHGRRAADQLGKLRDALEQASKGGGAGGGLPLPLSMGGGRKRGDGEGQFDPGEEVRIPGSDNKAPPRYRQELLDAAKQKPPAHYEDAVRQYYEELIR